MNNDSPQLYPVTHGRFQADILALARSIEADAWTPDMLVGVGRGGLVPAVYLSHRLNLPMLSIDYSNATLDREAVLRDTVLAKIADGVRLLIVDDINDTGGTIAQLRRVLPDRAGNAEMWRFAVLLNNSSSGQAVDYWADMIDRRTDKRWFVFPWEALATQQAIIDEALSVPDRLV